MDEDTHGRGHHEDKGIHTRLLMLHANLTFVHGSILQQHGVTVTAYSFVG